jgi:hypothetical protein
MAGRNRLLGKATTASLDISFILIATTVFSGNSNAHCVLDGVKTFTIAIA